MRQLSYTELLSVSGGSTFASIGTSIGSTIGSALDSLFNSLNGKGSTALSSSLGTLGAGLGGFLDIPKNFAIGAFLDGTSGAFQNGVDTFFSAVKNVNTGLTGTLNGVLGGIYGIFA